MQASVDTTLPFTLVPGVRTLVHTQAPTVQAPDSLVVVETAGVDQQVVVEWEVAARTGTPAGTFYLSKTREIPAGDTRLLERSGGR